MEVLLITEPSGARLPCGKHTVEVRPRCAGHVRAHDYVVRIDAIPLAQPLAQSRAAFGLLPPIEHRAQRFARDRERGWYRAVRPAADAASLPGTPPAWNTCTVAKLRGPFGRQSTMRGTRRFTAAQSSARGRRKSGGMRHAGQMQDQVRRSAKSGVHHHGVLERTRRSGYRACAGRAFERQHCARRAPGHIQPDGMAGRRQRGMRQRHAQRFAHHLRRGRGAQELAAAAGRSAGAAAHLGGVLDRDLVMRRSARRWSGCGRHLRRLPPATSLRRAPERRADRACRPEPSSSRAGPCRRSRRR